MAYRIFKFLLKKFKYKKTKSVFSQDYSGTVNEKENRVDFILSKCRGKKVIHFGFLDSPFMESKYENKELLHEKIKQVSNFTFGIDINENDLKKYRELTGDNNNMIYNVETGNEMPDKLPQKIDVIVFSEVLEHIKNPFSALTNLKEICVMTGAELIITVPNAFSIAGLIPAANGYEIVHPDHYYYFSPNTLKKLLTDAGFSRINISYYLCNYEYDIPGLLKHGIVAVCS